MSGHAKAPQAPRAPQAQRAPQDTQTNGPGAAASDVIVPIGVVVSPHGVRGELRVKLHNPDSELLMQSHDVLLRGPAGQGVRPARIESVHVHRHGLLLVAIASCHDRDEAIALRGAELCIARAALPPLPKGEHYLVDMIGLKAQRPDGQVVGIVTETIVYPASNVLRVVSDEGAWEVPWVEPYVVEVRLADGVVIVNQLGDLEFEPLRRDRR